MRKGLRKSWVPLILLLMGAVAQAARPEASAPSVPAANASPRVPLTVELSWTYSEPIPPVADEFDEEEATRRFSLEVTEGKVFDVLPWKSDGSGRLVDRSIHASSAPGKWELGTDLEGRIRARVEATLDSSFVVKRGDQVARVSVASILDHPQKTPAEAPLKINVARLPWDALSVEIGQGGRPNAELSAPDLGEVVAPGATVPVAVGHRIVTTEAEQVTVNTILSLRSVRGGPPVWKQEQKEVVTTNRLDPPVKTWKLTAPKAEGAYILEIHSAWDSAPAPNDRDSSSGRIGRLIRRHRGPSSTTRSASRQVGLVVFDSKSQPPKQQAPQAPKGKGEPAEAEVDAFDLSRVRNGRFGASGRSPKDASKRSAWEIPTAALKNNGRREGLRAWIPSTAVDVAGLGPVEPAGVAWSAAGLKVVHPDRPHRLTVTVLAGDPSSLSVAVVDPGAASERPRVLLDACGSGPPILPSGAPSKASWLIWPDTVEPTLILANRSHDSALQVGSVRLVELDDLPPPPYVFEPKSGPVRALGLYLSGPDLLDRFGGGGEAGFLDIVTAGQHLAGYLKSCGATDLIVSEDLADRAERRLLGGQAVEDSTSPDRLDLLLMVLQRYGCRAWLEIDFDSPEGFAGLPPVDSPEALARGLVRVDRAGQADGPTYHPLHEEVRAAMKSKVVETISRRKSRPALGGLLIRLGPGPTLLGTPDTGLDDSTYQRFVNETFGAEVAKDIPGLGKADSNRFSERLRYLSGVGRVPWLTWRSRAIASLYADLSKAVREASPGAELALATPTLDDGPAGNEARRVDLSGLSPAQAWRSVGLDFQVWPNGPEAPIVVRGSGLSTDELAHDLATNSDLDSKVATRSRRGMMLVLDDDLPSSTIGLNGVLPPLPAGPDDVAAAASMTIRPFPSPSRASGGRGGSGLWIKSLPLAEGPLGDEIFGHALASFDSQWFFVSSSVASGNEERLRRIASVLRAIPAVQAEPSPTSLDLSKIGVSLRMTRVDSQSYLAIANDTPYPIRLALNLAGVEQATPVDDLGRGTRLAVQAVGEEGGRMLVIDLSPFGASAIRVGSANAEVNAVTPYPSQVVLNGMEAHYKELSSQLARLNRSLSGAGTVELPSTGFEPNPEPQIRRTAQRLPDAAGAPSPAASEIGHLPVGWKVEGAMGASAVIDGEDPHSGSGSAKLVVAQAPASFVSDSFVPNTLSALTIEAFLRSEAPNAKVRVWVEGQAEGKPFVRRSELVVSPEWKPRAFRADDIPPSGLESARLRFEMLTAGTLWIDDVRVINEQASKSARLNAQRALLSALQAYREKRYADFARLGSSHWTKHPGVLASIRPGQSAPLSRSESTGLSGTDPAAASALPADRAVR